MIVYAILAPFVGITRTVGFVSTTAIFAFVGFRTLGRISCSFSYSAAKQLGKILTSKLAANIFWALGFCHPLSTNLATLSRFGANERAFLRHLRGRGRVSCYELMAKLC